MYEQGIAWVGLALLLVLCLPFAGAQKLVLEVYARALRLALLALPGAAASAEVSRLVGTRESQVASLRARVPRGADLASSSL